MAFQVEKIHPLDLQPRKAVGVGLPFSSKSVFNSTYTTKDAIKANLINYFLTEKGERFLNPALGAGLRALLFDQMTEDKKEEINYTVRQGVAEWFPSIIIKNLNTEYSQDTNTVTVSMNYSVFQTNIEDQLVINFEQ
jgi:phage baseplate assembly protein W